MSLLGFVACAAGVIGFVMGLLVHLLLRWLRSLVTVVDGDTMGDCGDMAAGDTRVMVFEVGP